MSKLERIKQLFKRNSRVPRDVIIKEQNESSFPYSSQYYDYHRNALLFLLINFAVTIFGVKIDLSKVGPLSGSNDTLERAIPALLLLAASYCLSQFYSEWIACAKPHRNKIRNEVEKLRAHLDSIKDEVSGLASNLEAATTVLAQKFDSAQQSALGSFHTEVYGSALNEGVETFKAAIETIRVSSWIYIARSESLMELVKASVDQAAADELISEKAQGLMMNTESHLAAKLSKVFRTPEKQLDDVIAKIDEISNNARDLNVRASKLFSDNLSDFSDSRINLFNIHSQNSKVRKSFLRLSRSVEEVLRISEREWKATWIKTELAGKWLPMTLLCAATTATIHHYFFS